MDNEDEYVREREEAAARRIHHSMMIKIGRRIPKVDRVLGESVRVVSDYDPHKW